VGGADYYAVDHRIGGAGFDAGKREFLEASNEGGYSSEGSVTEDSLEIDEDERMESGGGAVDSHGDSRYPSVDLGGKEQRRFEATRSLVLGKVRANRLEVSGVRSKLRVHWCNNDLFQSLEGN